MKSSGQYPALNIINPQCDYRLAITTVGNNFMATGYETKTWYSQPAEINYNHNRPTFGNFVFGFDRDKVYNNMSVGIFTCPSAEVCQEAKQKYLQGLATVSIVQAVPGLSNVTYYPSIVITSDGQSISRVIFHR